MDGVAIASVGDRVATLRKLLGLKQYQLAQKAHVSVSLLKKVESGHAPASPSFTAACARALGVDVATLTGQPYEDLISDPSVERSAVPELRRAMDAYDDPQLDASPMSLDALRQALDKGEALRRQSRYAELSQRLPLWLRHAYVAVDEAPAGHDLETANGLLDDAYALVHTVGHKFGYFDLAAQAIDRLIAAAEGSGDPLRIAVSAYCRSNLQLHQGNYGAGIRTIDRALRLVDEKNGGAAGAVAVQLHLRQAILAARSGSGDDADAHVKEARTIVRHGVPATPYHDVYATTDNVDMHSVAVPVEMSDGTAAVARAEKVHIPEQNRPSRACHHHIDVARAWVLHGDRDKALASLITARRIAPQQTRYHPSVHETLHAIAAADRRATDSLAGFARWAGLKL